MSAPRRALLGGLVAAPAIAGLPTPATASSAFAAAWAAYQPYSDARGCKGLTDDATDAWCEAQTEVTADLAEAPAGTLTELEAKLAAGLYWFGSSGAPSSMTAEEADLLRSCLTDLRAIMDKGTPA